MTVSEAIFYIEDIVDKYSTEYYEPKEILNRVERETYVALNGATKDSALDIDVNWDIASLFIEDIVIPEDKKKLIESKDYLRTIGGYIEVDGVKNQCYRRKDLSKDRNPFTMHTEEYPVLVTKGGDIVIDPFVKDKTFAVILKKPTFGKLAQDLLIYKEVGSTEIGASRALIDRVLSGVVVSLVGSQFNQTMQYEWAKLNKQEKIQNGTSSVVQGDEQEQ